jgi:8-oxo-dGTP diphosphatase
VAETRQRIAAYGVICDAAGRVLLVRASSASDYPGRWFLPGGGVQHGEHPEITVVREVGEETGLHVAVGRLLRVSSDVEQLRVGALILHTVRLLYAARVIGGALRDERSGSTDVARWCATEVCRQVPLMPFVGDVVELDLPALAAGS